MLYHPRYKTNDDPFGLLVLTLRKKAGLTQVEMAKSVGVTEKTVRNWERGTDFPSESNLKKLIETYLCRGVFTPGQEREEAKTLWERACQSASRRKAIFDEMWFTVLLAQQQHPTFKSTAPAPRADSPEGPPRLRGSGAPALKNSTADQLAPLLSAPFRLRQADWGEASDRVSFSGRGEEASHSSPLASSAQLDRLLVTKRTVPSRRARLVPRAHLTGRLQAEPGRKLTLISAPAGFGKTTLLLDWIMSGNQRVAWLSLDEGDNDPVRFWRYVVVALQSALAKTDLGTSTLAMLLELLFGDVTPSGKLPITFPRSDRDTPVSSPEQYSRTASVAHFSEGLFVGYRGYDQFEIEPLFPFGYGLSYTSFAYAQLQVEPETTDGTRPVRVSFTITNTGARAGAEIAQVYLGLPASTGEPPRRLAGWAKVELEPGETREVSVPLDPNATSHPLSYWDVTMNGWEMASGDYRVDVGASSRDIRLTSTLHIHQTEKEKGA